MNSLTDRDKGSNGAGRRATVISLATAAAFSALSAPSGADEPAATAAQRPEVKARGKPKNEAPYPGPIPFAVDPAALRKLSVDELLEIARLNVDMQRMALIQAGSSRRQAALEAKSKMRIDQMPPMFRPADAQQVLDWSGEDLGGEPYTIDRYHSIQSVHWMDVASRYAANTTIIFDVMLAK